MLEKELIIKCKNGDGEAFRYLMLNYKNKLFGYLWRFGKDQFHTEEMFQETLIKVWKGISNYNDKNKFSSWLFTIAHNVAIDYTRKKNLILSVNIDTLKSNPTQNIHDDKFIQKETVNLIIEAVDILSEKQKRVFLLRQHGELSFKEIAKITNEPLNTVLSHMNYAVKKIRKQLEVKYELR